MVVALVIERYEVVAIIGGTVCLILEAALGGVPATCDTKC